MWLNLGKIRIITEEKINLSSSFFQYNVSDRIDLKNTYLINRIEYIHVRSAPNHINWYKNKLLNSVLDILSKINSFE